MQLAEIRALIQTDLAATDQFIMAELTSEITFINQLVEYILTCGGKRIRPLLVLLAAKACQRQPQSPVPLAAAIEMIHTATLLHDDVVDHSSLRRGQQTANMRWGNEASVLIGDFLYSRAFQIIVGLKHFPILEYFAAATNLIAEGEVLQLLNCHNPDITEEDYFKVIERKTAKLFEVAAQSGAALVSDDATYISALKRYGWHIGMAYQLIDDALDYNATSQQIGKNIGQDLIEGKPTLPLLYAMQHTPSAEQQLLRSAIKEGSTTHLPAIIEVIESTGAIEYTANAAKVHMAQAQQCLASLPDSPYRDGLYKLAEYLVARVN